MRRKACGEDEFSFIVFSLVPYAFSLERRSERSELVQRTADYGQLRR
jgi:hypothetical protein